MSDDRPRQLRIFISHKMPTDTPLAEEIGGKLALYAGERVRVRHAGQFRYGDRWRDRIQRESDEADWLIFLYTAQDEDWGFCLFECGYFRHVMQGNDEKLLITFCRKSDQVNDALREFNAIVINDAEVTKLLNQIYRDPPWRISPTVEQAALAQTAGQIASAFQGVERVEANFDVAIGLTIELSLTDAARRDLKACRIPAGTVITGIKDWQRLFGKDIATGGWIWQDLAADWAYSDVYDYLVAKMIDDALDGHMPRGILLRAPVSRDLFRVTLRRYERMANDKYRFHFTAAPLDLPFDIPSERTQKKETVLYHLVNLSWHFQRRIVDELYNRLLEVEAMPNPRPVVVGQLYDAIGRELMDIQAQSIIRGVDNPLVVNEALGSDDPEVRVLLDRLESYGRLSAEVFGNMAKGAGALHEIAVALHQMAMLNFDFYHKAAAAFASLAQRLEIPREPKRRARRPRA